MAIAKRFLFRNTRFWLVLGGFLLAAAVFYSTQPSTAQDQPKADPKPKTKAKPKKKAATPAGDPLPIVSVTEIREEGVQIDFPAAAADSVGTILAFLHHDGKNDVLRLARKMRGDDQTQILADLSKPGVLHQPAVAVGKGGIWAFWGELADTGLMQLIGRQPSGSPVVLAQSDASESFAHAGTDSLGRVWVVWQSLRAGNADIYARYVDEFGKWSAEIAVATSEAGEWEPRVSFDDEGNAWVAYDSSAGNEFNINLAKVTAEGAAETYPIGHSPRYEARADLTPTAAGDGFWITAERGRVRWGKDVRGHGNAKGLNAQTEVLFGKFDISSKTFTEFPLGPAGEMGNPVNLPTVHVDSSGRPWVAYRYFERTLWRIAVTRFDPAAKTWSSRRRIPNSSFGQDRRAQFLSSGEKLQLCYPSDLRKTKAAQESGIYLVEIDPTIELPDAQAPPAPIDLTSEPFSPSQATPEREKADHFAMTVGGKTHKLYWGDVHRHTDVSNCRTGFDGCIAEHFRYAYDLAKLDFLGTSDHTDIGKIYDPYEWWHNQRMHDAFHSPGRFNSVYVYEREQRWPWGHRNIVFAQRGGPIVYINRTTYRNSPWQADLPVKPGVNEIHPTELWDVLERYGLPVASISHTGATGMGTDWGKYEIPIDHPLETVVEIFQGARVSYEGIGVPQPTAGLRPEEKYTIASGPQNSKNPPAPITDFGKFNAGVYQNALKLKHRLGVFASSDHIAQHVSYGGVFCEEFTREGIIKGLQARHTVAATDKIYAYLKCNDQAMGSILTSAEKPKFWFTVQGTAKLKRVTVVRNEEDWKVMDKIEGSEFEQEFTDDQPQGGENRYYLRVEQEDGNMAWTSPVWVTVTGS